MNQEATGKTYLDVEDLQVYQKLCQFHLEICDLSHTWPAEERYELGSQIRRSSNSSPAQLAEKHDDRHVRNKVEGVNRSRGEAGETIHHLFMAKLKGYIKNDVYAKYREHYKQCIRMLNGLEKSLERRLPEKERRWAVAEAASEYGEPNTEHRTPNTEHLNSYLLIMIICAAFAGCVRVQPKVNTAKPTEYMATVQADRAWQNSHIHVRRGQVIQCKAEGQWNDHFASYGPEGNPDIYKKHFGVNAPANSLIMQISSQTNRTYFIGKQTNVVAERSGEILFRKNYSLPIGMDGEIKVKVKVCSDADGDGISDYDEIHVYKTNPLSPDSNGNGFSDLEEINDLQEKKGDNQ